MNRTPSAKEGTTAILEEEFNSASQVVVVVVDTPVPTIKAEQEETRVPAAEIVVTASQPEPNGYVPATTSRAQDGFSVGKWETDLFDCFTHCVPNCFMATFFPCVSVARISAKLNIMTYRWALTALLVLALVDVVGVRYAAHSTRLSSIHPYDHRRTNDVNPLFIVVPLVNLVLPVVLWFLRAETRSRFSIPGSCCVDCLAIWCCSCCAIAQMSTQVKSYKPNSCDFGPPEDTLPAYIR
jgi:Cys-rich protein (TIGR01571 family)